MKHLKKFNESVTEGDFIVKQISVFDYNEIRLNRYEELSNYEKEKIESLILQYYQSDDEITYEVDIENGYCSLIFDIEINGDSSVEGIEVTKLTDEYYVVEFERTGWLNLNRYWIVDGLEGLEMVPDLFFQETKIGDIIK